MAMDNMPNTKAESESYFQGNQENHNPGYYGNTPYDYPGTSPQPNLRPEESPEAVGAPQTAEEAYLGSFQAVLEDNLGYFVVIEFLIGTNGLTEKEGVLYAVGNNFDTLYEQETDRYIVCDMFSIKFVTFFRQRPSGNRGNRLGYESGPASYGGMVPRG